MLFNPMESEFQFGVRFPLLRDSMHLMHASLAQSPCPDRKWPAKPPSAVQKRWALWHLPSSVAAKTFVVQGQVDGNVFTSSLVFLRFSFRHYVVVKVNYKSWTSHSDDWSNKYLLIIGLEFVAHIIPHADSLLSSSAYVWGIQFQFR